MNNARFLYVFLRESTRFIYQKYQLCGKENLPAEPFVVVGNHAQIHGPLVSQLYMPMKSKTWTIGEMMHPKEVPAYAFRDFWSEKPKSVRWIFKICSYLIVPLAYVVFGNADVIGVYHDKRIINTFKESLKALENGISLVIFPECPTPRSNIVYEFQEGYADLGRMYGKKTGKKLAFVPMYTAVGLKEIHFGKPEYFDFTADPKLERARINEVMMDRITETGQSLPPHKVVPYKNVPKSEYPMNR